MNKNVEKSQALSLVFVAIFNLGLDTYKKGLPDKNQSGRPFHSE
ncbi:MAG: hypothetical protein PSV36_05440 [Algoriphagus sp.]|nr:hypothetical protein [Algoriphagus sp.]